MQSISLHQALIDIVLEQYDYAVISYNELACFIYKAYKSKKHKNIPINRIKKSLADKREVDTAIDDLIISNILRLQRASFFSNAFYLISGKQKNTEEEMVCALAPFGVLSHLSAMFIHGITDRIPNKIYYTAPTDTVWRRLYLEYLQNQGIDEPVPHYFSLAPMVSGEIFNRPIQIRKTKDKIPIAKIRNSPLRVTTIGKTFVDMLRDPSMCGGEDHVLDVFINEAPRFQNEIIKYAEQNGRAIDRSRIGFIFDKILGIKEPRIKQWKREQVRGGSKKLSPNFSFSPVFDEGWCLSINIESAQQYI